MEREEWLKARKGGIGGTDISAIVGLNPYKTPFDVYIEKMGLSEGPAENRAMRLGKKLEPVIAGEYELETGHRVVLNDELVVHPRYSVLLGTPDGYWDDGYAGWEAKAPGIRQASRWGEQGSDQIPEEYLCQAVWYLAITGKDRWEIAALFGGQELRVYTVLRNKELEEELIEAGLKFWTDHILKADPPPPSGSDEASAYLSKQFPSHRAPLREATTDESALAQELAIVREQLSALDERKSEYENRLKATIGEAEGISLPGGGRITWKASKPTESVDYKAIVAEIAPPADLILKHTATKPGARRFLLTPPKP